MKRRLLALIMALSLCICVACKSQIPASAPLESSSAASPTPPPTPAPEIPPTNEPANDLLNITMLGINQISPQKNENDLLSPIWREKTGVATQVVAIPDYIDYTKYLEQAIDDGTLPDLLALETGIFDVPERYELLLQNDTLLEISFEEVEKHMPLTAERLEKIGVSLRDWYDANIDAKAGKWLYVPKLPSTLFDESIRSTAYGIDSTDLPLSYVWVRDDILSAIKPNTLTALDLSVQFSIQGDDLPTDVFFDWGIRSLKELSDYMSAVAELSESGSYSIIPMRPLYNNTASSVIWSLFTVGGSTLCGDMPEFVSDSKNFSMLYSQTKEWKEYIFWLNASNSKGYFGNSLAPASTPENSYAILNWWLMPGQRATSPVTGIEYGWRLYPLFISSAVGDKKASSVQLSLRTKGAVGFNKNTVTAETLPTLLAWVDWNYSLEAQDLRNWGVDLTVGEGESRRFKEEFEQLRNYMINGAEADGSGWRYGLVNVRTQSYKYWNHEVYGVGGSDAGASAPFYTYPANVREFNQSYIVPHMVKKHLITQVLDMEYEILPHSSQSQAAADEISRLYEEYKTVYANEMTRVLNAALMDAVRCSPADFENRYRIYRDLYDASRAHEIQGELMALLQEKERSYITN